MRYLVLSVATLGLIACNNAETNATMEKAADIAQEKAQMHKGIEVSNARIRPPAPGRDIGAGFFKLTNHGPADRLVAASSPISTSVEIHNHINDEGVMRMRKIEGLDIATGETIKFKPGSYHLMFYGMTLEEGQTDAAVTLTYEKADPVTLIVPIMQSTKKKDGDSHKGH